MAIRFSWASCGLCLALASAASAGNDFNGGSFMTFSNAFSGGPNLNSIVNSNVPGGVSTTTFSTDVPQPNVLTFTGVAAFAADAEQQFVIGNISYFNGVTYIGDQGVNGAFTVQFTVPALPVTTFAFDFDFVITQNTGNPVTDADLVSFLAPGAPTVFVVGSTQYTLAINGFRLPDNTFVTTLNLPEGSTVNAEVMATFTTNIVPTPAAASLLGLSGVFCSRRRR